MQVVNAVPRDDHRRDAVEESLRTLSGHRVTSRAPDGYTALEDVRSMRESGVPKREMPDLIVVCLTDDSLRNLSKSHSYPVPTIATGALVHPARDSLTLVSNGMIEYLLRRVVCLRVTSRPPFEQSTFDEVESVVGGFRATYIDENSTREESTEYGRVAFSGHNNRPIVHSEYEPDWATTGDEVVVADESGSVFWTGRV